MIKIIKKGTRDIRECESCGCLFSFDNEDINFNALIQQKHVKCPQCGKPVVLEAVRTINDVKFTGMAIMPDGSNEIGGIIND